MPDQPEHSVYLSCFFNLLDIFIPLNGKQSMKLKTKFIIAVDAIIAVSYGILLFRTSVLQHELVIGQAQQQARMLHKQILLTRQWVADHRGLFVVKTKDVTANPFLDNPLIRAVDGQIYVKRNPAMVTRELSEYASKEGVCRFRVTSLKPINPANMPDEFERTSLKLFEQGKSEIIKIIQRPEGRLLRYVAPLKIGKSCLGCHARHGYKLGDVRGALSIMVPISWADTVIANNNRAILIYGLLSIICVAAVISLLFNTLVGRRLNNLARAMENYPQKDMAEFSLPTGDDEIGLLSSQFQNLFVRLEASNRELDKTKEQAFYNEKMAALGQLTAGIAHEINNPLGGLLNCVKTMQQEPDNVELHRRYLPLLDKGLYRIEHTMRQLLNFGRKEPLRLRKVEIDRIIRECFELLEYRLRNIELDLNLEVARPHCLDVEAIKQIVVNIGLNAIQAMPDGGRLSVHSQEINERIILRFCDSGSGIAPEILDKIFDPFFTTKDVGEGTGLGLAVTYSLVKQMNGTIEVDSILGQGSDFTIILPSEQSCLSPNEQETVNNQ